MHTLRLIVVGSVFGLSILTIGFICADRLAHPPSIPVPVMAQAPAREPAATGSILPPPVPAPQKSLPVKAKATDGFDTERLNALLRGDPISPPRR